MYLSTGARYVGPVGVPVGGDLSRYLKELFKNSREGDGIYPTQQVFDERFCLLTIKKVNFMVNFMVIFLWEGIGKYA